MQIEVMPALIDQYRETFEGPPDPNFCWITDGRADAGVLGTIAPLSSEQAFAAPVPEGRSIAEHVAHLRYTLDITRARMQGGDPKADWPGSFNVADTSPAGWEALRSDLGRAYDAVLSVIAQNRNTPVQEMVPLHLVGLAALIAHNAYHLGAIRQIARVVTRR